VAALFQASNGWPALKETLIFCLGAFLMRSAGSTVNDIADRNFDAHVERTRFRPLASGQISTHKALFSFYRNCYVLHRCFISSRRLHVF
jgi:4-hydroxybenzoate polyprenyltransferase